MSPRTSVFLSDVETDSWPPDTVMQLAAHSDRWLVTRGEFGAHEFTAEQGMSLVEPVKVAAQSVSNTHLHSTNINDLKCAPLMWAVCQPIYRAVYGLQTI